MMVFPNAGEIDKAANSRSQEIVEPEVEPLTTTKFNCRGGSRASVGAATPAALPRVFLQRVPL
jgi:hypothetical protein